MDKKDGATLADALSELIGKINTNIVLIIDEIQETLKSESGRNLLSALKAARDAVNLRVKKSKENYLLIVGTGSHRSFVSAMASRPSQPFYGADRKDFPLLGKDFIDCQIKQLSDQTKILSEAALNEGFLMLGSRPKVFRQVLREIQSYPGNEIDSAFLAVCSNQARMDADEFLDPIKHSDAASKLLFTEIAKTGQAGCSKLFSTPYLKQLSADLNRTTTISTSTVQSKLNQMLKKDWIYPTGYGCYAVSDPQAGNVWLANLEDYSEL